MEDTNKSIRIPINFCVSFFIIFIFITCQYSDGNQSSVITKSHQVPEHPRILLLAGEEDDIKKLITPNNLWDSIHQLIISETDRFFRKPPVEYELEGRRLLVVSREFRKRIFYLSYAWRMTHDKKYLERAEKELLIVSAFTDWNPSHFLDVAEMTMGVAIGFDWLYNDLPQTSLTLIKEAIIKKGIEPSFASDNNKWISWDNNWNQVCNAGMVFGALAVYDDEPELARKVINRSIESIRIPMQHYNPDGAYPEGYGYWTYGTTFNVYLISALEKAFNSDFDILTETGFLKTAGYLANMVGPSGLNFNYSDSKADGILNPAMFWLAKRLGDNSLLHSEKIFFKVKDNLRGLRDLPAIMIWGAGIEIEKIMEPKDLIWVGRGKNAVAMLRSSWKSDAIYVGLKAGTPDIGHGHMDVGSFVVDAIGERWAMDFGGQHYTSLESHGINLWSFKQNSDRWKVFRYNNLAHNTLSFNKEFQRVDGNSLILKHTTESSFLSATTDLTEIYADHVSKAWRGVAIVDGKYIVIKDEIELADLSSSVRWNMLTEAKVTIIAKDTAQLIINDKRMLLIVKEPGNVQLVTWSTQSQAEYDYPNPGTTFVGFEIVLAAKSKKSISVILIPQPFDGTVKDIQPLKQWKGKQ